MSLSEPNEASWRREVAKILKKVTLSGSSGLPIEIFAAKFMPWVKATNIVDYKRDVNMIISYAWGGSRERERERESVGGKKLTALGMFHSISQPAAVGLDISLIFGTTYPRVKGTL